MSSSIGINRSKSMLRQLNRPSNTLVFITIFAIILGVLSIANSRPANAASTTVNVPCDGSSVPGAPVDQYFTVAPGDSVTFNSSVGTCNTLTNKALDFWNPNLTNNQVLTFSGGTTTLNISGSAIPGSYQVLVYQTYTTRPGGVDPGIDYGQRIQLTILAPTDPNSITSCGFNPTSNTVNYGDTVSSTVTLGGTPTAGTSELYFWHKRVLDGTEITTGDPDEISQADVLVSFQPTIYNYGSSVTKPGYYYPNHTLVEEFYAINVGRTAPYGSALCTLTTTFGPAPSTTGTQQIAYTSESCANIKNNNAKLISNLDATIAKQGNKSYISGINPGSAFYWAKVNLNGSTSTSLFTQSSSNSPIRLAPMGSNYIYDSNCNLIKKGPKVSVDSNGSSASFSGGVSGATYYIAIKLGPNYIVNQPVPSSWPVTLTFSPGFGASTFDVIINSKK